jgi:ComF family protein
VLRQSGRLVDGVVLVLFAPRCAVCHALLDRFGGGPVCRACWDAVPLFTPPLCTACGAPLGWSEDGICAACRRVPRFVDRAASIGPYEGSLREIIHALKYEGRRSVAANLAALMATRGGGMLATADLVVPVPLHWRRRYARGFNQAEQLARRLGLPVARALVRVRATRSQIGLAAPERRQNVRGAFRLKRMAGWRRRLTGTSVVLIDDVSTTGATLEACAEVLKAAGVREVRALTAARTVSTSGR